MRAARVLAVLAAVLLVLAIAAGYARHAVINSGQFANRATAALDDSSVRSLIAQKITDDVVLHNEADLIAARPIIESVASDIVGSAAFQQIFRSAVRDGHRALFEGDQHTLVLTIGDVATVLAAALEKVRPALARKLDVAGRVSLYRSDIGSWSAKLVRVAHAVRLIALFLALGCALLAGAALVVSPDTRRTVVELGIGAAAAGVFLVVALGVGRRVAIDQVHGPDARAAAGAVWDAFLLDLRTGSWIVAGSGAVVAAAAASLIRPVDVTELAERVVARVIAVPQRPWLRVLHAIGLVALGVVVIVERDAVIQLVLTAAGVWLIYLGITSLLRMIYRPVVYEEEVERARARRARWLREGRGVAPVVAAALIVAAVTVFLTTGGASTAAPAALAACEGHRELCDRPLDQVALPATHNSMSAPLPGWFSSEQDRPIAQQLADGIRGLLIDTHYADRLPDGKLRTFLGTDQQLRAMARQDGVAQDAVDAAMRIRDRLGFAGTGTRGMYLCHSFCELGATPLASALRDIRDFLVAHPAEVVVVINQDYVTPADFVGAVQGAGLGGVVYRGPTAPGRWPTLRQMIDSDQRLVLLAENHAGAAPWYHLAYQGITEETPFKFTKVGQLTDPAQLAGSCRPNRGPAAGAPLFLLNHWITTDPVPLPTNAAKVNARAALLARARTCQRARHHIPNLVAVNFYREGDLFRVVDELNGVR